jgi:uncharacterized repeat protein (TIGR03803 family)
LIQPRDGHLYGTTAGGGAFNDGTIFKLDAAGRLTTIHTFTRDDGGRSGVGVLQATDGSFYGTADASDPGAGTIFKIDSTGRSRRSIASAAPMGAVPDPA